MTNQNLYSSESNDRGWYKANHDKEKLQKEVERLKAHLDATTANWNLVISERDQLREALDSADEQGVILLKAELASSVLAVANRDREIKRLQKTNDEIGVEGFEMAHKIGKLRKALKWTRIMLIGENSVYGSGQRIAKAQVKIEEALKDST